MTKMSKILWEGGHALSTDPHLPPRLCGLDFEPPPLQISGYATAKHWRRVDSHPDRPQSNHAHLTVLQYYNMHADITQENNVWIHVHIPDVLTTH